MLHLLFSVVVQSTAETLNGGALPIVEGGKNMSVNNIVLVGRLATDVKVNEIGDGVKQAKFTLAVDRRYKRKDADKPDTDFIKINAVRGTANFAEQYFKKGKQVSVVGSVETYSYQQEERTIYDFCVKAEQLGFADSLNSENKQSTGTAGTASNNSQPGFNAPEEFSFLPDDDFSNGDDLPF